MRRMLALAVCLSVTMVACSGAAGDSSTTSTSLVPGISTTSTVIVLGGSASPTTEPPASSTTSSTSTTKPTVGWVASTASGRITISGFVADIHAPFTLQGVFQGGEASLTFVPIGESGGSYSYTGGGSGVKVSGQGSYTLEEGEGETYTLTYVGNGCADPGGCSETTAVVTLTPQTSG